MDEITKNDKDLKQLLLEYVAYAMSGMSCKLGKALIMVGDGANGKSTFTDVVKALMGSETYANVGLAELGAEGHRINLKGRLASFGDEVPANAFNKGKNGVGETFKSAVTGGEISGRELYSKAVNFHNKAKFFLSCNELPHVNDHSNGLFRRMLIAPFDAIFNKGDADTNLGDKLRSECPGILNRVLEAYKVLDTRGDFIEVEAVDSALNEYREGEDMILSWYKDHTEVTKSFEDKTSCAELFQSYLNYCEQENARFDAQIKQTAFSRRLSKLHPFGSQYRVATGGRVRGFSKIKLIDVTAF
jgi:putative DNA primase/helicase